MMSWLQSERERTKAMWQRIASILKENKQFKTKTDVVEASLALLDKELTPKPKPYFDYEHEHDNLCIQRYMVNQFSDIYFSKENLEKLRERYPNIKRFREEREKAKQKLKDDAEYHVVTEEEFEDAVADADREAEKEANRPSN